jgi:hypothetical protein
MLCYFCHQELIKTGEAAIKNNEVNGVIYFICLNHPRQLQLQFVYDVGKNELHCASADYSYNDRQYQVYWYFHGGLHTILLWDNKRHSYLLELKEALKNITPDNLNKKIPTLLTFM